MIKNVQLIKNLRRRELQMPADFNRKVKRYEQMYNIARKLNSEIGKRENDKHLKHLVELAGKFKKVGKKK